MDEAGATTLSAQGAADEREAFLAAAVHEIRSSVTVVVGAAQTLKRATDVEALSVSGRELLALIDRGGQHLLRLIGDLLTSAYLEHGLVPVNPTRVRLRSPLSRAIDGWSGD